MEWVGGGLLELGEVLVEGPGRPRLGVDEEGTNADLVGGPVGPSEGVLYDRGAEADPLGG